MIYKFILLLFTSIALSGTAQNKTTTDTVIYYSPDQKNYYFEIEGKNQKFYFDSVIYDNYRPITVFIKNNTPNLISIYPRYHANTFWKHNAQQIIEPNAYFKAELIISETKKFERIGHFIGFLKIEYWDTPNSNHKKFELNLKGKLGLGSLPPFKENALNEKTTPNESPDLKGSSKLEGNIIPAQKKIINTDTIIVLKIDNGIYTDTLPFPIPGKYDTLPYREDKIWIKGNFHSQNGDKPTTWVNRKVFLDGTVLEYYQDGKLYSKRIKVDSSDLKPYFTSYYQDGKLGTEKFINQTIEYDENGKIRSITKEEVKTSFFDNGKIASIENLGKKRNVSSPFLTTFYFKTGCRAKEVYLGNSDEGETVINYREDLCDCPENKINITTEIYYKNCVFTIDTIITRNYPSIKTGKFDRLFNLISGKVDIGRNKGKNRTYSFRKLNNHYLSEFTFRRFAQTSQLNYRDSIFVTEFNRLQNAKKQGIWLACNLSTQEFVDELIRFEKHAVGKSSMADLEFIFQYPWEIYQEGHLEETQYYSIYGDILKRIKFQGTDTIVTYYDYDFKLLLDSNQVNLETPKVIYHSDTRTYFNRRYYHNVLIYENQELKQKTSPILQTIQYHSEFPASSGIEDIWIPFTIEKGEFKDLQLYNGTIEYYDKNAKLIKTSSVVNGK